MHVCGSMVSQFRHLCRPYWTKNPNRNLWTKFSKKYACKLKDAHVKRMRCHVYEDRLVSVPICMTADTVSLLSTFVSLCTAVRQAMHAVLRTTALSYMWKDQFFDCPPTKPDSSMDWVKTHGLDWVNWVSKHVYLVKYFIIVTRSIELVRWWRVTRRLVAVVNHTIRYAFQWRSSHTDDIYPLGWVGFGLRNLTHGQLWI